MTENKELREYLETFKNKNVEIKTFLPNLEATICGKLIKILEKGVVINSEHSCIERPGHTSYGTSEAGVYLSFDMIHRLRLDR